ncbi:SEC-C motif family protein [Clostridium botulinum 202F]|uniref:SEC-C metal-binding domain-containing protein n=1 Tax=unclassified Clostridium TaxID=2614128 RepID=UPI000540C768|nr:SEC-C motif family protein [Clostridium botulinum 202F]KAI3344960.1 SEC-C domain-containing protein [Clostridium botulinum]KON14010.1 hypothetical protein ACP50_08145 [Clostridium botulinum]
MDIKNIEELFKLKNNNLLTSNIEPELKRLKKIAVENMKQDEAKHIWCLEKVYLAKKLFIEAFRLMKEGDFERAWNNLDRSDIELNFLKSHFDYSDNKYDLLFIENEIPKYQELFPYDLFTSRESIESDFTCSICGAKIGIRNKCEHKVGEIYNGEMCVKVVNKIELLGIAIVRKPFDKYTILHVDGIEYNYFMLENLMKYLDNPFEKWGYETEWREWNYKNDETYKDIGRNDLCLCGSGRKFKKCCLINKSKVKHYKLWGECKNFNKKNIPFSTFYTKKHVIVEE